MKVIYIAGPYNDDHVYGIVRNIRRAEEEALFVWSNRGVALCPHTNTALFDGAYGIPREAWLNGDLELLRRCDAIYMIGDWQSSQGAKRELEFAGENNIRALFTRHEVIEYLWELENHDHKTIS